MEEQLPLNLALYESLLRRFGQVRLSNAGGEVLVRYSHDTYNPSGRGRVEEVESGEYYRVNCPYCGDTRYRLYVNYRWNTLQVDGRSAKNLACCFNEHCDLSRLPDELKGYIARSIGRGVRTDYRKPETFKPVEWPGVCIPLDKLPAEHAANRYVRMRQFDPEQLARDWDVRYCLESPHALARDRLVIPVYWAGELVGWQTRAIGDRYAGPKYYTTPGLKKAQLLFNGDRARAYSFGVVVEGPFDAFRVGPAAVALLGKSMSNRQRELVVEYWGKGALCVLLDPDAAEDMERVTRQLNPLSFKLGAWSMVLPDNKDPADLPSKELWGLIAEFARSRQIAVT